MEDPNILFYVLAAVAFVAFVAAIVVATILVAPRFGVYRSRLEGQAELARSGPVEDIRVVRAKARLDAATYEAKADLIRGSIQLGGTLVLSTIAAIAIGTLLNAVFEEPSRK